MKHDSCFYCYNTFFAKYLLMLLSSFSKLWKKSHQKRAKLCIFSWKKLSTMYGDENPVEVRTLISLQQKGMLLYVINTRLID